jgi:CheY-like chemotaxis protein
MMTATSLNVVGFAPVGDVPRHVETASSRSCRGCLPIPRRTDGRTLPHHCLVGRLQPRSPVVPVDPDQLAVPFTITRRSSTATDIAAFSPTPPPHALLGPPILVVDDDPFTRELLSDLLCMQGYIVRTAKDGAEALRVLQRTAARLVLLDLCMPVLDGWGFARTMKERRDELPLVVLSAAENAQRWAAEIGAVGYVGKPFEVDCLLDTIGRVLHSGALPRIIHGPRDDFSSSMA